jgi:predicted nucleic acid-binding protein
VAAASLARYDGSAGVLVDTNVWVDCMDARSPWHTWAVNQLQLCSEKAPLHVNLVIYTELLVPDPDIDALDALLDVYDTQRSTLPWASAALAAKAFGAYRRRGGARLKPLPDFFIGAHAAVANFSVLTRDAAGYKSYFPRLVLLKP